MPPHNWTLCRLGQRTPPASLAITCQSRGESPRLPPQHCQALSPRPREIPVAATASNAPVPRGPSQYRCFLRPAILSLESADSDQQHGAKYPPNDCLAFACAAKKRSAEFSDDELLPARTPSVERWRGAAGDSAAARLFHRGPLLQLSQRFACRPQLCPVVRQAHRAIDGLAQ